MANDVITQSEMRATVEDALEPIERRLAHIEEALRGDLHNLGLISRVNILWKSWIWVLCSGSALVGSALTLVIKLLFT